MPVVVYIFQIIKKIYVFIITVFPARFVIRTDYSLFQNVQFYLSILTLIAFVPDTIRIAVEFIFYNVLPNGKKTGTPSYINKLRNGFRLTGGIICNISIIIGVTAVSI